MKTTALVMLLLLTQVGCVAVGYSSTGGWFFWPGGLVGLLVLVALLYFLSRRRR